MMTRTGMLLAAMLCVAAGAAGQERITLEEAQGRAAQASHRLAEARARVTAAESAVEVRTAADRPQVTAAAGYTRTNHVTEFSVPGPDGRPRVIYPDVPDNYRTRLDLQWPIYNGGRGDALERAARAEAAATAADVETARMDLRLDVARTFWALVTARATVGVLEEGVSRAQAHLTDVRERLRAGLVPPNEVASAEALVSRQRMLLIEAGNQRDLSSAELARLMGVNLEAASFEPVETLDARLDTAAAVSSATTSSATLSSAPLSFVPMRPERQAIEHRIDAADEQRVAAAAGARPILAIVSGYDFASPNPRIFPRADRWDDSWDAGVNVSWSLWDGGRTRAAVAQAAGLATAARARLEEFDSIVALEVRQRRLEIDSGQAAVSAVGDAIRAAAEARRVVAERYRVGVATQTEVLDADFALLQAELDRTRALSGVRFAEARLARALGR